MRYILCIGSRVSVGNTTSTPNITTQPTPLASNTTSTPKITTQPKPLPKTTLTPRPVPRKWKCPKENIMATYYNSYHRVQILITQTKKLYFINHTGLMYGPARLSNYFPWVEGQVDTTFMTTQLRNKDHTILFVGPK